MNSTDLLLIQRRLRDRLLDGRDGGVAGSVDLAAHMLVYLDDEARCWQLALDWLRTMLDADRASGSFSAPDQVLRVAHAEALRPGMGLPSGLGSSHEAGGAWLDEVWHGNRAVLSRDVASDAHFAPSRKRQLRDLGMRAQLALPLRDGAAPVGLVLCGWNALRSDWLPPRLDDVEAVSREILGPILRVAGMVAGRVATPVGLAEACTPVPSDSATLAMLTPGELEVARLVVTGMSYKEIAYRLNRSFSTVDHRLRAIREKLGARSTARMMVALTDLLASQRKSTYVAEQHPVGAVGPRERLSTVHSAVLVD